MNATDFKKGDRVIMTEQALNMRLQGRKNRRRGIVTGHSRNGEFIRVWRDGLDRGENYAPDFWRKTGK